MPEEIEAFAGDLEKTDLAAGLQVGAAAQFPGEIAHGNHAHGVAVFFFENSHGPAADGVLITLRLLGNGDILPDLFVDGLLDFFQFFAAQGVEVGEIKAQLVRPDARTRLFDMQAQHFTQGGLQQVGGGMMDGDICWRRAGPLPAGRCL